MHKLYEELQRFNWFRYKTNNKQHMLNKLQELNKICNLCRLCKSEVIYMGCKRDPHMFSNMCVNPVMLIDKAPTPEEATTKEICNNNKLYSEFGNYGIYKEDLYITNLVKCCPSDDTENIDLEIEQCSIYLKFEINIIKPKFIIAINKEVFSHLCDKEHYNESLSNFVISPKYGTRILSIDQKSLNQIRILSTLIKSLSD